ncbi:hypothetical protein F5148DRAFT_978733 [Russula earlei]|uniref:Uncharacterized protein n=1 Tax=Russula earlei TaxID=71964 RepID=A0ACC0UBZ3_9AGAM|nr:hypothetical protein F5148DRAFT_978733 [Russula earlei]
MRESYCNPNVVGGAGEQSLMQITHGKCNGAPNGDVATILFIIARDYNIGTAEKFFAALLETNYGNVLETVGQYNGWKPGMT